MKDDSDSITKLDIAVAVMETKIDVLADDLLELKADMKEHMDVSAAGQSRLNAKIDKLIWTIIVGGATIIGKMIFFTH